MAKMNTLTIVVMVILVAGAFTLGSQIDKLQTKTSQPSNMATVTFMVRDAQTLMPIENANVGLDDPQGIPAQTNQFGVVSIETEKGEHQWFVGKVGYSKPTGKIDVIEDMEVSVYLTKIM